MLGSNPSIGSVFPGAIDEVAVYDHALSPARILAHYQYGTGQRP